MKYDFNHNLSLLELFIMIILRIHTQKIRKFVNRISIL